MFSTTPKIVYCLITVPVSQQNGSVPGLVIVFRTEDAVVTEVMRKT